MAEKSRSFAARKLLMGFIFDETRHLFIDWKPIREEVIKLVRKGQREEAAKITMGKEADIAQELGLGSLLRNSIS